MPCLVESLKWSQWRLKYTKYCEVACGLWYKFGLILLVVAPLNRQLSNYCLAWVIEKGQYAITLLGMEKGVLYGSMGFKEQLGCGLSRRICKAWRSLFRLTYIIELVKSLQYWSRELHGDASLVWHEPQLQGHWFSKLLFGTWL